MRYSTNFCIAVTLAFCLSCFASAQWDSADVVRVTLTLNSKVLLAGGRLDIAIEIVKHGAAGAIGIIEPEDDEDPEGQDDLEIWDGSMGLSDSEEMECQDDLGVSDDSMDLSDSEEILSGSELEAGSLLTRLVAAVEGAQGPENPKVAEHLYGLAQVCIGQGRFAEAQRLVEQAGANIEKRLEPARQILDDGQCAWAGVCRGRERLNQVDSIFRQATALYRMRTTSDSTELSAWLDRLEGSNQSQAENKKSRSIFKRVFGVFKKLLGLGQSDPAVSLVNLADLYCGHGEAKVGIAVLSQILGLTNPEAYSSPAVRPACVQDLVEYWGAQNDLDRAGRLYRRSIAFLGVTSGADSIYFAVHPVTVSSLFPPAQEPRLWALGSDRETEISASEQSAK